MSERATLLVIEDEQTVRTVMRRTLESRGYTVLATGDPREGLDLAREHDGPLFVSFAMAGIGDAQIDDISIRVIADSYNAGG